MIRFLLLVFCVVGEVSGNVLDFVEHFSEFGFFIFEEIFFVEDFLSE